MDLGVTFWNNGPFVDFNPNYMEYLASDHSYIRVHDICDHFKFSTLQLLYSKIGTCTLKGPFTGKQQEIGWALRHLPKKNVPGRPKRLGSKKKVLKLIIFVLIMKIGTNVSVLAL